MKVSELLNYNKIGDWLEWTNPKPNTRRNYLQGMQFYTDYLNKSPDELIKEIRQAPDFGDDSRIIILKRNLAGFRTCLQKKGLAPTTIKGYMTGIRSFYTNYDILIPKVKLDKPTPLKKNKKIPSKEDLQAVLHYCDTLEKAIILVGVSSGLSANEIINLTVADFENGYDPDTEVTVLDLRRSKVEVDFMTCLTPEASRAVKAYLEFRARTVKTGEKRRLQQLEKQRVLSPSDALFIKRKVPDRYLQTRNDKLRMFDIDSFVKIFCDVSEKSGMNTPFGDYNIIRSHNMRKYFNSALRNKGVDADFREFLMGHSEGQTKEAYFIPNAEDLKKQYIKVIPYLTVQKELDISESEDFRRLKTENEALTNIVKDITIENQKILTKVEEMEIFRAKINEYFMHGGTLEVSELLSKEQKQKSKHNTELNT